MAAATLLAGGYLGAVLGGFPGGAGATFEEDGVSSRPAEVEAREYGGYAVSTCDEIVRSQLVFQHKTNGAVGMNSIIRQVQNQRVQQCHQDAWRLRVVDPGDAPGGSFCWDYSRSAEAWVEEAGAGGRAVRGLVVPLGLMDESSGDVRLTSWRDADNNMIIYFSDPEARPSDRSRCWLYVDRTSKWEGH